LIERAITVPLAFLTGVIVSITLCSAGPYLIALVYIGKLVFLNSIFLFLIYNAIFVFPLVVILVTMSVAKEYVRVMRRKRKGIVRVLSLLEGILLIVLAIYLLISE